MERRERWIEKVSPLAGQHDLGRKLFERVHPIWKNVAKQRDQLRCRGLENNAQRLFVTCALANLFWPDTAARMGMEFNDQIEIILHGYEIGRS